MPLLSRKRKLLGKLCEDAVVEMVVAHPTQGNQIFDNAVEDVIAVYSQRCLVPRLLVPKSDEWFRRILPNYGDDLFRTFMRVSRQDFNRVLMLIENNSVFKGPNSYKQLEIDEQLALTLYKFGNDGTGSGIVNVAALFGVGGGGTVMKVVTRVIEVL